MLLERYLAHHAEPEAVELPRGRWRNVLTVPAFDESPDFADRVLQLQRRVSVLLVVCANAPESASAAARERTRVMARILAERPDTLVIDRVRQPVPRHQGVGLARKLAADTACRLIQAGRVECPLIFMTDADVTLPAGYFARGAASGGRATVLYPFRHETVSGASEAAVATYELHLRRYVRGLADAGSAYAFHALGSTIAIHAETYAAVRGMPRRNAGEDFYLLNKAAKVDPVRCLGGPEISIRGRFSGRVPFGTGPALRGMPDDVERFVSYPEAAFRSLGELHACVERWARTDTRLETPEALGQLLEALRWPGVRLAAQHPPGARRWRAALEWLDGFRCMRIVRELSRLLPPAPLLPSLRAELGMPGASPVDLLIRLRAGEEGGVRGVDHAVERPVTRPP